MSTETKHSGMPLKVLVNFCRVLLGPAGSDIHVLRYREGR